MLLGVLAGLDLCDQLITFLRHARNLRGGVVQLRARIIALFLSCNATFFSRGERFLQLRDLAFQRFLRFRVAIGFDLVERLLRGGKLTAHLFLGALRFFNV